MSDASRAMRLMALAVHEVRTPATVIGGCLRMIRLYRNQGHEKLDAVLAQADRNYDRLVELLAEISDLWRLEVGEAVFNRNPVPLDRVLGNAARAFAATSAVSVRSDGHPSADVMGDPTRLERAFAALLGAVARQLPEDGAIRVVAELCHDATAVRICVGDDATPAPPAEAPLRELDEFQGGLGLALPIARRVFEHEGGTMRVTADSPGTIVVELPTVK